tara:strand:- start:92782 stop:93657 length:876 start_codon:yes stop_codon:yes gene_type:complete
MKINSKDFKIDNLTGTQWVGVVEDNVDTIFEGRCRVRVFGKFDLKVDNNADNDYIIPTDKLPWARPTGYTSGGSTSGSGQFSVPKLGSFVKITFDNGNIYTPTYHENIYPSGELKAQIEGSYNNAHALLYDTGFGVTKNGNDYTNERDGEWVKIYFTEENGLVFDYATTEGSSVINIKNNNSIEITNPNGDKILMENDGNITMTHSGNFLIDLQGDVNVNCQNANIIASEEAHLNSPRIKLGEAAVESVIKGDTFKQIFDSHIHPTGVGPSGPPTPPSITNSYLSTQNTTD